MGHTGPVIAERYGLKAIDCKTCGWAHLDPLPVVDDEYYKSEFWKNTKAGWLAKYEAERDWLRMRDYDFLSVVEEHTGGRTLLDVGAGYGFFMQAAKERNWAQCCGVDLSQDASDYAKQHGIYVEHMSWQDTGYPIDFSDSCAVTYACISALWLMEHLISPSDFLGFIKAHLAPGGVFLAAVPQEWTDLQARANNAAKVKNYWVAPSHINYWSQATFYNLLGRAGFRVVDALASWPMENFILGGKDYTANETVGDEAHAYVRSDELIRTHEFRLKFQRDCARYNMGRDLVIFCKVDA